MKTEEKQDIADDVRRAADALRVMIDMAEEAGLHIELTYTPGTITEYPPPSFHTIRQRAIVNVELTETIKY